MYEDMTYETIIKRMLDRIPNSMDKRQGSVIYDAIAPVAAELAQMYIELDSNMKLAFASTSTGEYLELRAGEVGVIRHEAIKAKRLGLFYNQEGNPVDIPLGSRLTAQDLNYVATERLNAGQYVMECETPGAVGNIPEGRMTAIEFLPGVARAEITDVLLSGEEAESDSSLLARYLQRMREPATSGNIYHYAQWAREVPGVGNVRVVPATPSAGYVRIAITDIHGKSALEDLINQVAAHIEVKKPVNAGIEVVPATEKPVIVSAKIVMAPSYTLQDIHDRFVAKLGEYFSQVALAGEYVSYALVGAMLLEIAGIVDYSNLLLNGITGNVALQDEEAPVIDEVVLTVI